MKDSFCRILSRALSPLSPALVRLLVRGDPAERQERLGRYQGEIPERPIWLHAASAGEMEGTEPLVHEIRGRTPSAPLIVTTMTRAGKRRAERIESVPSFFVPLDFPNVVRRAFQTFRPSLLLLVETEIWPNLIREAAEMDCPVAIVNGRLSERAARRMDRVLTLYRSALRRVTLIGVQRDVDRERFLRFGAAEERTFVHGNTKIDTDPGETRDLGVPKGEGEKWVVFGSVRDGEEAHVLRAVRAIRDSGERVRVVVAPRHPNEGKPYLKAGDISWRRWSEGAGPDDPTILVDTVGDLLSFYHEADIAFVGGSLSPHGGHNPLEPARFGVPVLLGPHLDNCRELADFLIEPGAAEIVSGEGELAEKILYLLKNEEERRRRGKAAEKAVASQRGAAARCVDRLVEAGLLGGEEG